MFVNRPMVVVAILLVGLAACGGSGESDDAGAVTAATASPVETSEGELPTATGQAPEATSPTSEPTAEGGSTSPAASATTVPGVAGAPPNRFCVDGAAVETTLNLRAGPSTDAEILASIPRSSCDLVDDGQSVENNFQPVLYTTVDGAVNGWVSSNFVEFQDPPARIEAAALLFVKAWQLGLDTGPYSYGVGALPAPITAGDPVLVEGPDGIGCVLVGDVTIDCSVALVERDGTEIARLSLGATQRGTDGNDGTPYFADDFPDGPRVTSFAIVDG